MSSSAININNTDYVLVPKKTAADATDNKAAVQVADLKKMVRLVHGPSMNVKGKGKLKEYPFILPIVSTFTSGVASTQSFTQGVIPGSAGDFNSLAGLFDEFIVDKTEVIWDLACNNSNTADIHAAWAYDPINSGAYTTVVGVLEASQHFGPVHLCNQSRNMNPLNHTPTGMWKKMVVMPKGPEVKDPGAATVVGTGQWTSTSVATTSYGYIKGFCEAPSAGLTTTIVMFLRMFCRFRSRT